jgi:hypothetical protein
MHVTVVVLAALRSELLPVSSAFSAAYATWLSSKNLFLKND